MTLAAIRDYAYFIFSVHPFRLPGGIKSLFEANFVRLFSHSDLALHYQTFSRAWFSQGNTLKEGIQSDQGCRGTRKYLAPEGGEMVTWFSAPATLTLLVTPAQLVVPKIGLACKRVTSRRGGPGDYGGVGGGQENPQAWRAGGLPGKQAPESASDGIASARHRGTGIRLADGAADGVHAAGADGAATGDFEPEIE